MAENTTKPVLVEYDVQRPLLRLFFGFLEAMAFVGVEHGYPVVNSNSLSNCAGGWTAGFQFITYLGVLAVFIEIAHWAVWRIRHRKGILSFEEEQRLFGKSTKLGVRKRRARASEVQELFGNTPAPTSTVSTPMPSGPQDYNLVESGGRLLFVPRNPVLAGLFGCAVVFVVFLVFSPGPTDSCVSLKFSWLDVIGRIIVAYGFLAFGSIAELRIAGVRRSSAAT
jgi:hypothetical protein